ncbi:hypothetical protein C8Q77DRAFT_1160547 [Trametes polyzona]|nr:hypothetical protein C8Q77DRAFT_1160547 [Trametes polyzona]
MVFYGNNYAQLERRFGRTAGPTLGGWDDPPRRAYSPRPATPPALDSDPARVETPPLLQRLGDARAPSSSRAPTPAGTDMLTDDKFFSAGIPSRPPSPQGQRAPAGRVRPALPLEQRLTDQPRAPSRASRGRSPGPRPQYRPPPREADRMVFAVFRGPKPSIESRVDSGPLYSVLSATFERSHDLAHVRVDTVRWTTNGNITVVLSAPPPLYRTCLGFRQVLCHRPSSGEVIPPQEAAAPLFRDGSWEAIVKNEYTRFRWGRSSEGVVDTTETLPGHPLGESLTSHGVRFVEGGAPSYPFVVFDRAGVTQCEACFGWGHTRPSCRVSTHTCARCGGPHLVTLHNQLASCCQNRPDRDVNPCTCPPVTTRAGPPPGFRFGTSVGLPPDIRQFPS